MYRRSLAPPARWGAVRRALGTLLAVALALGTAVVPEAWAADYYVNPTSGDDANDGSAGAPWRTLTHALGQVAGGDVVHLAAGLYDTPGNGETFPLALVDGVTILGDVANPANVVISAPPASQVFFNNDTPLGSSTRLAGVTVQHDATSSMPLMEFAVGTAAMSPRIDHNAFVGSGSGDDDGIQFYDISAADGTFTPTIDGNSFDGLYETIVLVNVDGGPAQVFAPTITNNTFTSCAYAVNYSIWPSPEGTVGGLVQGNTFTGSTQADIYMVFSPTGGILAPSAGGQAPQAAGITVNTTITGNTMQGAAIYNAAWYVYGGGYSGDATFAPTLSNNSMEAGTRNVMLSGYYNGHDGDYTLAPVISGNTMTGASNDGVLISLTTLSVANPAQRNVFSPTVTNNTITGPGGDGVDIELSDWSNGHLEGTVTVSGNTITNAGENGVEWSMSYMSDGTGMDWSIVISNNTITAPSSDGIYFSMESMSFSGSGAFTLTMEGNTISGAGSDGIHAYPAYSWYSDNQVAETVLIRGNTVTGSTYDGIWLYFSDQTSNTLDARITDNVIQNNGSEGLQLTSNDLGANGILMACNLITGNARGIYQAGQNDPPPDYGGGNLSSAGGNVVTGNTFYNFLNYDDQPVMAENNWWGSTDATTIDGSIYDDDESSGGAVDFQPFLTAEPSVTITAPLTDSVANDVAPPGPSAGDTLLYTAQIAGAGCGDVGMTFTATVDPNTTVVPGSVTTTQGTVTSESPPTVNLGYLPTGTTATVTWQVLVLDNGQTQVQTQGTVTATRSGTTLTDDPDAGGTQDPTVTPLVSLAPGTVQFAVAAVTVSEAAGSVTLDVTRTGGADGAITVNFATADGTAVAPGDYTAAAGQLTWADQDTSPKQIVVPIVDDPDVEGDETFTVTLTDPQGGGLVGSPATATVTIQDNDVAVAIPTLGQWGMALFSGLLLLLGLGLLRRRRWAGAALAVLLAAALAAVPARAADDAKPVKKEVHVGTLTGISRAAGTATLTLSDGKTMTVPESIVKVRRGHVKPARGEARSQRPTREEREALRRQRKAESARAARLAPLQPDTPVLVTVKRDRDGRIRRVKVWVYDSVEQAQAELARKEAGRKHPRE